MTKSDWKDYFNGLPFLVGLKYMFAISRQSDGAGENTRMARKPCSTSQASLIYFHLGILLIAFLSLLS